MDENIFYYNFGWKDMTTPSCDLMLDIVQVIDHELSLGGKVAVHCHAGRGRTGLVIACVLVYQGLEDDKAITEVRAHRPGSIQTKKQTQFVMIFHSFLQNLRLTYPEKELRGFLRRQRKYLHGEEMRLLRGVPKVVLSSFSLFCFLCIYFYFNLFIYFDL
jgi:protein tyrosine phosphatase domain-containing protein 1